MGDHGETSGNASSFTANDPTNSKQVKDQPPCVEGQTSEASKTPPEVTLNSAIPLHASLMGTDAASFGVPLFPAFYLAPFPGVFPLPPQDQPLQSSGIYAVPVLPFTAFPPGGLIPLSYNVPLGSASPGAESTQSHGSATQSDIGRGSSAEAREAPAPEGLHQHHGDPARDVQGQRHDHQRQVVRRFQVGFQLDLLLILKLAVVVFVFNQDGSKERLFLLLFLATLVYLYQTGALAPLLRWLSQSAQRARLPPPPPARAVQAQQAARPEGPGQEGGNVPNAQNAARQHVQAANTLNGPAEGVEDQGAAHPQGLNWWGFVKEIQMIVIGFVMSLFPGFHHAD